MTGILAKAMSGAGKGIAEAAPSVMQIGLEQYRSQIMAERDVRLKQYEDTRLDKTLDAHAEEGRLNREAEAPTRKAQAANLEASAAETRAKLKVVQETEKLYAQYMATEDPKEKENLAEAMRVRLGKDQDKIFFGPMKDELGNITGYKAYSKISGQPIEQELGKPAALGTPGAEGKSKDFSSLWGGGKSAAPASKPQGSAADTGIPPYIANPEGMPAAAKKAPSEPAKPEDQFLPEQQGTEGIPGFIRSVKKAIEPAPAYVKTDSGQERLVPGQTVRINNKEYRVSAPSGDGVWKLIDLASGKAVSIRTTGNK